MDSNELKSWIVQNNVKQRTIESFWRCFEHYRQEEPDEFAENFGEFEKDFLVLWMSKIVLTIRNWDAFEDDYNENHEFVEAYIELKYKNKDIGYYSLIFNFSGEIFDNYFALK